MPSQADSTPIPAAPTPAGAADIDIDALLDEAERLVHAAGRELAGDPLADADDAQSALDDPADGLPPEHDAASDALETAPTSTLGTEPAQPDAPSTEDPAMSANALTDLLDDLPPASEVECSVQWNEPAGTTSPLAAVPPELAAPPSGGSTADSAPSPDTPPPAIADAAPDNAHHAHLPQSATPDADAAADAQPAPTEAAEESAAPPELLTSESSAPTSAGDAKPAEPGERTRVPQRGLVVRALLTPLWLLAGGLFVLNLPFAGLSDESRRAVGFLAIGTAIMAAVAWLLPVLSN